MIWCLFLALVFGALAAFCFHKSMETGDWWAGPGAAVGGFISAVCLLTFLIIGEGFLLMLIRIAIMCVAGAGVVVGWKQYRFNKKQWGKTLTVVSFCVAMLFAYVHFRSQSGPSVRDAINTEAAFQSVAARTLGRHLAERYDAGTAVVICTRDTLAGEGAQAEKYRALKKELERGMTVVSELVAEPEMTDELREQLQGYGGPPSPGGPGDDGAEAMSAEQIMSMMPQMWWTAERFDELLADLPTCDVVVCTAPPPVALTEAMIWTNEKRPKFAFSLDASSPELIPKVKSGDVVAMIQRKPGSAVSPDAPPRNLEEAFAERYILITPENPGE